MGTIWSSLTRIQFSYEDSDVGFRFQISSISVMRVVSSQVEFTPSSRTTGLFGKLGVKMYLKDLKIVM